MARQRDEKEEKTDEKRQEKSPEEKWVRDPVSLITWAAVLIWVGLVLLAENLQYLTGYAWRDTGAVIFTGMGVILLIEVLFRLIVPHYRRSVGGTVVLALIFLAIGLGGLTGNWAIIGPIAIIAVGLLILIRGFFGRRKKP